MFLIFIGIIVFAIIIMAFCTPPSDNKDTTKKEKTDNDDFEDFIHYYHLEDIFGVKRDIKNKPIKLKIK